MVSFWLRSEMYVAFFMAGEHRRNNNLLLLPETVDQCVMVTDKLNVYRVIILPIYVFLFIDHGRSDLDVNAVNTTFGKLATA